MDGSDGSRRRRCGWRQIAALILPSAQVFLVLLLLQVAGMATDGEGCRGPAAQQQRKEKKSVGDHDCLI
jgi:hypothetical protein